MSSSEEYLDSLLKSLTEGESQTSADSSLDISESDMADDMREGMISDSPVPGEPNKAMSMNEIEAVFASMGEPTEEEMESGEALSDDMELNENLLDDSLLSDGLLMEEEELSEEMSLEEGEILEEQGDELEEALIDDFALDESLMSEEMSLEEGEILEEQGDELEEALIDDFALDESLLPEEMSLEEGEVLEEQGDELEEALIDDFALDESLMSEEMESEEEELPEEMSDELEEEPIDDFVLDDSLMPGEMELEEDELSGESEEKPVDDLVLSDLGLDDLGFDDDGQVEEGTDSNEGFEDDFVLEESGEDDEELSALLADMDSDEDLAEINDLLEKADQGMSGDEDMLAMLGETSGSDEGEDDDSYGFFAGEEDVEGNPENIREITPEELEDRERSKLSKKEKKQAEKERKKKEKEARKNKKKKGAQVEEAGEDEDAELDNLLASMDVTGEKPKKQGFFGKIMTALLEEDEDEETSGGEAGNELGSLSEENRELLSELNAEDRQNAKKKEKKEKKGKKGKKKDAEAGAEGEGEAKKKKPKKEKKKKKEKEKNPEDAFKAPEKKLSKKKVTSIFLFCATVAACIILLSMLLPNQIEKQEARVAYDYGQYEQVYELLYGKSLSEEDDALLQKSSIILQTKRKLESYENYSKLDMPLESLNALLEGVNRYQNLRDEAELYHISDELYDVYEQILAALETNYGVSESEALDILSSGDDVTYSQRLQSIVYGDVFGSEDEEQPEVKQDVLPEEEEIIDRLQGEDSTEVDVEALQTEEIDEVTQAEEEALAE